MFVHIFFILGSKNCKCGSLMTSGIGFVGHFLCQFSCTQGHLPQAVCPLWPAVVSLGVTHGVHGSPGFVLYVSGAQCAQVTPLLSYPAGHTEKEQKRT